MDQARSWNDYWLGDEAMSATQRASELFRDSWREWLTGVFSDNPKARMLDAACGAGAVTREAIAVAEGMKAEPDIVCVDIAPAAIAKLADAPVTTLTADAKALPFEAGEFDVLVSQFGVEYAGQEALSSMGRLLAPSGRALMIAHMANGTIAKECSDNLHVLQTLIETDIVSKVSDVYMALTSTTRAVDEEVEAFREAAEKCGAAAEAHACPARDFAVQLFADCSNVLNNHQAYRPEDMRPWFDGQRQAIDAYAGRMNDMLKASLDEAQAQSVLEDWRRQGVEQCSVTPITLEGDSQATAWRFEARNAA
ncbi:class I SAM-dependent methyltransferase [Oceanicaulis sp. MMSF_3324]|uniref:class I SAM-dependent methyltransferase n=1 Tax=Oceanicaulis sp. MMSF_3324 TaxID=3046702 RepID=UPI00273E10A8|nr:class I SAM-dependent methyltransferase [Oceanicaulis sp. MMSF_3324]